MARDLQGALCVIGRREMLQFIFECQRLGARLEMTGSACRTLLFAPDAIGQRLDALPQEAPEVSCFRAILREQIVQKNDVGGHLSDLVGLQIERSFSGCDQQAQHQCGQRSNQACCQFHNVAGVRVEMTLRQQRPKDHPQQGSAKDDCEHKERDQPSAHRWDIPVWRLESESSLASKHPDHCWRGGLFESP